MDYKLYTLVDITHTKQYRNESGKEQARFQEQNFQTVLQILGIRANIHFVDAPAITEVKGKLIGFDTNEILRVWRFDFYTERDHLFESDNNPIGYLLQDFHLVPYISGLNELMQQDHAVFNTSDPGKNISFFQK
jgi:hypothetical protein